MRTLPALLLALLTVPSFAADKPAKFEGPWVINHELTDEIAPEFKDANVFSGLGNGRVSVSVMGVPIPGSTPRAASGSSAAQDPQVLSCSEMLIEQKGRELHVSYKDLGDEVLRKGDYRGRKSSWSRSKISQRYKSTTRKVAKTWEVRSDGRLLVTVAIDPNGDKKRTYKRVFDRKTDEPAS